MLEFQQCQVRLQQEGHMKHHCHLHCHHLHTCPQQLHTQADQAANSAGFAGDDALVVCIEMLNTDHSSHFSQHWPDSL